jgi:hypothetical protein
MRPDRFPKENYSVRDELNSLARAITVISLAAFALHRFREVKKRCEELSYINLRLEAKVWDLSYDRSPGRKMAP